MDGPDKLRMAPEPTPDELAARYERERRALSTRRESDLCDSLAPFRVGSVPYLNAVPLTRGLEDEITFLPPSQLAARLAAGELDAALLSVTEVLLHDRYDILDGIAIASLGEVRSVVLVHRQPLERLKMVHCDPASLTSVLLLKVLLAERGIHPEMHKLESPKAAHLPEAALVIGDAALDLQFAGCPGEIWDLGAAWFELTRLPFVYAVWALRRGVENSRLRRQLREARSFGLDTLDHIIATRSEYTPEFRRDYLGWHIHFHLGTDEKRGLARFIELLRRHTPGPVFEPRFVS